MLRNKLEDTLFATITRGSLLFYVIATLVVGIDVGASIKLKSLLEAIIHPEIIFAIGLSLLTASITTVLAVGLGIPAAYVLARRNFRGKAVVDTLLDLPVVMPPIAVGVVLLAFFTTPIGKGIEASGLQFVFSPLGIILAQFSVVFAVSLKFLKVAFEGVDSRQEIMARSLGCSEFSAFLRVSLPQAKGGIMGATVLTFAKSIGEFGATVILAGATAFKTEVLSISIFLNLAQGDIDKAMVVTLILIGISLGSILLFRRVGEYSRVRY